LGEHLAGAFRAVGERTSACGSLLFIDVDDFKDVNDSLGHEAGDALLIELVGRLAACISPDDMLARLGGDEFAIVVAQTGAPRGGSDVAEAILTALEQPVAVNDIRLTVSVSIGVAERRAETTDPAELLRQADFAMYMAKGGGKSRYQVFDALMHDTMVGRATLKADLADAVSGDQLLLEYQPVVDLDTGRVIGVEALLRWQHPTLGLLAPNEFIRWPRRAETSRRSAVGCCVPRSSRTRSGDGPSPATPTCGSR
jgi:diguanylate cyclase (GGDEF)-like protein